MDFKIFFIKFIESLLNNLFSFIIFVIANNPLSCQAYKNVQNVQQRVNINVDVDGSGPLAPFPVMCEFYCKFSGVNFTIVCVKVKCFFVLLS